MQIASLARAGQAVGTAAAVGGFLAAAAVASAVGSTVLVVVVAVGGTERRPEHACLFAHFFDNLLEELWESLGLAGAK